MSYNPRWYQEEAVDGLFDYFANHGGTGNDGRPITANPVICLPTGTGKSLVIGLFLMRAFGLYPRTRAMVLTHVKELISQNASKLLEIWPLAPLGVYSAGLNARDMIQPIIFGGIKSCVGKGAQFGFRDFLIIDEAHLIPGEGDSADYLKFIGEMLLINPYLKIIMLTATPYRMGLGLLTNGKIATAYCL
jgi:DNA repair protein RadD